MSQCLGYLGYLEGEHLYDRHAVLLEVLLHIDLLPGKGLHEAQGEHSAGLGLVGEAHLDMVSLGPLGHVTLLEPVAAYPSLEGLLPVVHHLVLLVGQLEVEYS